MTIPEQPDAEVLTALLDAAAEGVAVDNLRVSEHHDGFTVSVDAVTTGRLDRERARERLAAHPRAVANWQFWNDIADAGTSTHAFLRWAERADELSLDRRLGALADGLRREWGELCIRVQLGDRRGERRYELRHSQDVGQPDTALEAYEDPRAARSIAKFDDNERYRPLKTAPTLRGGWLFADLSGPELVRTIEFFYPATVANWHREREDRLDVTHYRETAARQTGIYEIVDELDGDQLEYLTEACCVDSQCLRRRVWHEDEDDPIDVPGGTGEFPCREPCSLVIAAARQFATVDRETPREYTFELTPTEKNQIETLIETVAEGGIEEIREADFAHAANRYRVRYLRAKRLAEAGLSAVPTFDTESE